MSRVDVLRAAGATPVIVFDGGRLPMKEGEEESRCRYETAPALIHEGAHGLQESTPPTNAPALSVGRFIPDGMVAWP